jgi:hypothetical protein
MPIDPVLPLVYVQDMGPTAKAAHDASLRPEIAQLALQNLAEDKLREESRQVQQTERGELSGAIAGDRRGGGAFAGGNHRLRRQGEEKSEDDAADSRLAPHIGKLVNKTI